MTLRNETREQTLTRLLVKAREDGIRLYRDSEDGRYYASSASDPDTLHYVTGYSCDCAGFFHHGACKHYAALMSALGWIAGEPEPPAPVACCECAGRGTVTATVATGRRTYRYDWQACPSCHGAKVAA
jgi:hypothetical protein